MNVHLAKKKQIVGHVIKPHGILFSGGPSITGPIAEGLHMEITMVQMYKVALSAGKAHRDHKHHHVHHFNHEGAVSTTQAPLPPPVCIYYMTCNHYICLLTLSLSYTALVITKY